MFCTKNKNVFHEKHDIILGIWIFVDISHIVIKRQEFENSYEIYKDACLGQ